MTTVDFPRVLVLCQNKIQPFTGGGVVLSNLFHQFPPDSLLFFHRDQEYGLETPYREYRITWRWLRPRARVVSMLLCWAVEAARYPTRARLKDLIALFVQSSTVVIPRKIERILRNFRPTVIYAWVGDSLYSSLLTAAVRLCPVPYVIHFMDNHVSLSPETPLDCVLYPEYRKRLSKAVTAATEIYTITESMGHAYRAMFGKRYEVFHGLMDTLAWPRRGARNKDGKITLAFTGSIERGQMQGLRDVAAAVDILAASGMSIRLVLYLTAHYRRLWAAELANFRSVEVCDHPDIANLRRVLGDADLLVLAYGFDERSVRYYQYSFATKIVPYMLSGRCILAYGPRTIEPIAYAKRGGWAAIVDEVGVQRLAEKITQLVASPDQMERLAALGYDAALAEHDLAKNSKRFLRSIVAMATSPRGGIYDDSIDQVETS